MKNFTKKFWSEGEFTTKSGGEYTGYVLVHGKRGYSFTTGEELVKKHNYLVNFRTSGMFFDRLLDDELELPYNLHQTTFAPNDFLNKTTLKAILKRLQLNNHYLFRCSTISETNLPCTSGNLMSIYSTYRGSGILYPKQYSQQQEQLIQGEIQGKKTTADIILQDTTFFSTEGTTAAYDLCNLVNAQLQVLERRRTQDGIELNMLLLLIFKDKLVFVRFIYEPDKVQDASKSFLDFTPGSTATVTLDLIDPHNKNSLKFLDIIDAKMNGNQLFVLDRKLNMLVKYDITSFVDSASVWSINQLRFVSSIQGLGSAEHKTYFNNPSALAVSENFVYVADNGNKCIKKYTTELDFRKTFRNGKYSTHDIRSISHCPYEFTLDDGTEIPADSLWILSQTTNHVYISIVTDDKAVCFMQLHKVTLDNDDDIMEEMATGIHFSYSDSNYFYVTTNRRTFKFHSSRPSIPIAAQGTFKQDYSSIVYNIWNSSAFSWDKVFDFNFTWDYDPQSSSTTRGTRQMCFCIAGDDSFNGDITFNITLEYDYNKVAASAKEHKLKFENLSSWKKAELVKQSYIVLYNEKHGFVSNISTTDFLCFDNEDVEEINDDEYIDALTFNKCIYKVAYNLIQLKNLLIGRFGAYYDTNCLPKFDEIITSDIYFQKIQRMRDENFFVHANEPNTILVNRVFECIWNLQQDILMRMEMVYRTTSETCTAPFMYV